MTSNLPDRRVFSGICIMLIVITGLACINKPSYVCYDGRVVSDRNECPRHVCSDGSVAASSELCPKDDAVDEWDVTTTLPPVLPSIMPLANISEDGPGIYYRAYHTALMFGDFDRWILFLSEDYSLKLNDSVKARLFFERLRTDSPMNITVEREMIQGDLALLRVSGNGKIMTLRDTTEMNGEISMIREDGRWKVNSESWKIDNGSVEDLWKMEYHCNNLKHFNECYKLDDVEKNKCISCFAKLDDKPGMCEQVVVADSRDDCYKYFAYTTGEIKYCKEMSTIDRINSCLDVIR
ncbi:MAG: hypothetical protein ABIH11_05460 [Candidatus Altiarchaeota archaeon]